MGVVWKGRDTRLDRFVALKLLPAEKMSDADRRRRFVQEAKAASALNHPNIITIYDIDQADGVDFIAMEFVPGKTLDALIPRNGMRTNEALNYAIQVAGALSAAHAAGIVHRDLKPGNVMVSDSGVVKVVDFGLAKLAEQSASGEFTRTETIAEAPKTVEGTIVGTVSYMSPEQAQGKKVDARSDIFSFGALLYEMLSGRRAFQGESKISTLAAILERDPKPVREIATDIPPELERLILQCLRKQPERRRQHMDDIKVELETLKEDLASSRPGAQAAIGTGRRRTMRLVAAGMVAATLLGAGAWNLLRPKSAAPQRVALTRLTWDSGLTKDAVLSPDGTRIAYASDRDNEGNLDIWIQQVGTGDRLRLTRNEADEYEPAFSPDGNRIVYRSDQDGGGLYVVSTLGGEPQRIVRGGRSPRFSPDGAWIAYWAGGWGQGAGLEGSLFAIPAAGGQPRPIRADFKRAGYPEWLPDGRHILFYATSGTGRPDFDLWVTKVDEDGTPAVRTGCARILSQQNLANWSRGWRLIALASDGAYVLLSAQSGDAANIWRVPISLGTFQASGPAEQLTFGTATETSPHAVPIPGRSLRMVFGEIRPNDDIWSLPLDANRAAVKGAPTRITEQQSSELAPAVSEDGRKVVYSSNRGGRWSLVARDLAGVNETFVATSSSPGTIFACGSRDGRRIIYTQNQAGQQARLVHMVAGGDPVLVCTDCFVPTGLSRDGGFLIDEASGPPRLRVVTTADKKGVTILQHPNWGVCAGRLSPDERWIAFHTIPRIDARQIYIAPFRGTVPVEEKDWIPVTDDRGMERYADWSPDGNTVYFLSERDGFRCIRAQRLDPSTKRPIGPPLDIYHFHHARLSLMNILDPVNVSLHVSADKAVFAIEERTGNIWMTELGGQSR